MANIPPNKGRVYIQRARVEFAAHIRSLSLRISDSVHSILESPLGPTFQGSLVLDPMFSDTPSFGQMGVMECWGLCAMMEGDFEVHQIRYRLTSLKLLINHRILLWNGLDPTCALQQLKLENQIWFPTSAYTDCPVNIFQVGSRPPGSVLKVHRQEDKCTIFLATGASNFLPFQQSNELCPMFNPGCNSSRPIMLLSLCFLPKECGGVIKPLSRVKSTEKLCAAITHSKNLRKFALLYLAAMKSNVPLFTK